MLTLVRRWWRRLSVQHKVWAVLLLLLVPLLGSFSIHLLLVDRLLTIQQARHDALLTREQVHVLHRLAVDIEDGFRGYLLTEQPAFLSPLHEAEAKLTPLLVEVLDQTKDRPILANDLRGIERRLTELLESKHRLLAQFQAGRKSEVFSYVREGQGLALSDALRLDFRLLEDRLENEVEQYNERASSLSTLAFWGLLIAVVGVIALGLVSSTILAGSITRPLALLQSVTHRIGREREGSEATGSLVGLVETSDEIGQLARDFEVMTRRVRTHIEELEVLNAIGHEINTIGPDGLYGVLRRIADNAADLIQADVCLVMQRNEKMGAWVIEAASGEWNDRLYKTIMLWEELPVSVRAFETGQPAVGQDLRSDPRPEVARRNLIGDCMLALPLHAQGKPFGVVALLRDSDKARPDWNVRLAAGLAEEAALAISNAHLYETAYVKEKGFAARLRQLEHLSETLAHDLKGPGQRLAEIAGILSKECPSQLNERALKWLSLLEENSQELVRRVETMMAVARVGSRQEAVAAVDAGMVIEEVLKSRAGELEHCRAHVDVMRDCPLVVCHRDYLRQVFDNLISNALKFASDDRPPAIKITASRKDNMVCFEVCDNGIGIPPEQSERVFEPFVRLRLKEAPGSGIGLAIVKRIVELYEGTIWIESSPGAGCSVKFTLRAHGELEPPALAPEISVVAENSLGLSGGTSPAPRLPRLSV